MSDALIRVDKVSRHFTQAPDLSARIAGWLGADVRPVTVRAVEGVDLTVRAGEVVGLVGESGCGKSTLGRMIAGILPPSDGTIHYRGQPVDKSRGGTQSIRVQMVFQDPFASLNPRFRVRDIIGEAPLYHGLVQRSDLADYVAATLQRVGLDPSYADRYPHQFSGGQRQRIGIARALAVQPEVLICDEAVAALDVSIQAQVLNLFMDLRRDLGLTYLFISHDLGVVEHLSDRVAIMYLGRIVELAPTEALFAAPAHPYSRALLASVPRLSARRQDFQPIQGEIPSPLAPPSGCAFHPRCPHAIDRCRQERPALQALGPDRASACHLNDPV